MAPADTLQRLQQASKRSRATMAEVRKTDLRALLREYGRLVEVTAGSQETGK